MNEEALISPGNPYDERTGYYQAYLMLRSQFTDLLCASPDSTDPRIRDMTEYAISSVVSQQDRERLLGILNERVACLPAHLDNEKRGRMARRETILVWGEISSWYDETLSILVYNSWGAVNVSWHWADLIAAQDPVSLDTHRIPLIIGGPVMRARPGFYAAHMTIRERFAGLLHQVIRVTDPRIRDMTEYAITSITDRTRRDEIITALDAEIADASQSVQDNTIRAQQERAACIRAWGPLNDWYDNLAGVITQNEYSSKF